MAAAREPPPPGGAAAARPTGDGARRRGRRRRLPARFVFALLANNFAQAVMLTLPFTLATYMVRDWLRAAAAASSPAAAVDERRVGELTGALTAAYSLAQAATSIPFGRWSDAHGRLPVLLLGSAASTVSVALFGLAGSLGPAILARAAGGALNAFIGAWKTALAEAAAGDEGEQSRVMSLMGLAWGVGCVLGPGLGGLLARPCDASNRPSLRSALAPLGLCGGGDDDGSGGGGAGLFDARPYALPCLVVAVVTAASGVLTWLWVPETLGLGEEGLLLPAEEDEEEGADRAAAAAAAAMAAAAGRTDEEQARPKADRSPLLPPARDALCVVVATEDAPGKAAAAAAGCQRRPRSAAGLPPPPPPPLPPLHAARRHHGASAGGRGSLELQPTPSFSKFKRLPYTGGGGPEDFRQEENGNAKADDDDDDDDDALLLPSTGGTQRPSAPAAAAAPPPPPLSPPPPAAGDRPPWTRCPYVRHALAGYCLICLHFIALEELVPLWASSPFSSGGLQRAPAQLALPLALNGAALVVFAALCYPPLRARLGTVPLMRYGCVLGACVAVLMPVPSLLLLGEAQEGGGQQRPALPASSPPSPSDGPSPPSSSSSSPSSLSSPPLPAPALALWLALMAVKAGAQATVFTGAMIRVNVAGRRAGGLGSINGVGQTLASLARGLGPAAAGAGWGAAVWLRLALAEKGGGQGGAGGQGRLPPPPPTQFTPFVAVAAIAVVVFWWYGKPEADDPCEEEK